MGPPGSEGADTWICADGIGYLGVAAIIGAMWALATVAGSLVAGLVWGNRFDLLDHRMDMVRI
jgi:hypothetical protein